MSKKIFITEYRDVTTAFNVSTSKMYSMRTGEVEREELEKYIEEQEDNPINCERKAFDRIMGISIGCANACNLACSYCYANAGTYNSDNREIMKPNDYDKLFQYLQSFD
uniref:hypothetical protein n=1 Tax=Succinivibrio sp. TaxID=2053619 RepID=UPI0038706997